MTKYNFDIAFDLATDQEEEDLFKALQREMEEFNIKTRILRILPWCGFPEVEFVVPPEGEKFFQEWFMEHMFDGLTPMEEYEVKD